MIEFEYTIEIDESQFEEKLKYNRGRLQLGDR